MVPLFFPLAGASTERYLRDFFGAVRLFTRRHDGQLDTVLKISSSAFLAAETVPQALGLIETEMKSLPSYLLQGADWQLSIPPTGAQGFAIDLITSGDGIRCSFGELEESFDSLETAMLWIGRGLGRNYQLRIVKAGGKPREWYLEPVDGGSTLDVLARGNGGMFSRSRQLVTTVIHRNSFVPVTIVR